ncbi:MAG: hypothetical protein AAGA20_18355 [Planctomycetota bacterium]
MTSPLPKDAVGSVDGSAAPAALSWRPVPHWRDLLVGRCPDHVLERILADDPLGLRPLASESLRAASLFLDADRVVLRALARVAHAATAEGPPAKRSWIRERLDAAIDDVLREERSLARAGASVEHGLDPSSETFEVLAGPLGLDGGALRRACDAFNRRPHTERAAFFALVVENRGLEGAAEACGVSPTELGRRARRALDAVLAAADAEHARGARS